MALRRGQRFVQAFEPVSLPLAEGRPARLRERGAYLITGGLGGVAFVLAATLAHACRARLVLTSRSRMPDRDAWSGWRGAHGDLDPTSIRIARVQALEGMGAEIELVIGRRGRPCRHAAGRSRPPRSDSGPSTA